MKTIHLIRHAKSSWDDDSLEDIDRPLSERGVRTCEFMASYLYDAGCCFNNVYSSPAVRAQSTIKLISKYLPALAIQWQTDDELYTFESEGLHEWCRSLDESVSEVLIIGHNPAFTDFCNELSKRRIDHMPTCGYAQLTARKESSWEDLSSARFELTTFLKPKKLPKRT